MLNDGQSCACAQVEGCLIVKAAAGETVVLENLTVRNAGYEFVALTEEELASVEEPVGIRGFKVVKKEAMTYASPGTYTGEVTCD
eukprot:COSAG05_NODE_586_length_8516_cov_12.928122_4_plen_85_part_00